MSEIKLCKDCKHFQPNKAYLSFWFRRATPAALRNGMCRHATFACPVTGEGIYYCDLARSSEDYCGKSARYFEAK